MNIQRQLERFIVDELLEEECDGGDPLAMDAVDSLGLEQLVTHIEEQFGVRFEDTELVRENFESVAVLASMVASKLEARAP